MQLLGWSDGSALVVSLHLVVLLLLLSGVFLRLLLNEVVQGTFNGVKSLVNGFRLLCELELALELLQCLLLSCYNVGKVEGI